MIPCLNLSYPRYFPCRNLKQPISLKLWQLLHGADRIIGRSNIWPLRRSFHTGPANRPQIRSLRRANIRSLRKATKYGERPRVNGFDRPNICTVPQRGCHYANERPLVNGRFFLMSFRSKKVTSGLLFAFLNLYG